MDCDNYIKTYFTFRGVKMYEVWYSLLLFYQFFNYYFLVCSSVPF